MCRVEPHRLVMRPVPPKNHIRAWRKLPQVQSEWTPTYPDILMMQPGENGYSDNAADPLDSSPQWCRPARYISHLHGFGGGVRFLTTTEKRFDRRECSFSHWAPGRR